MPTADRWRRLATVAIVTWFVRIITVLPFADPGVHWWLVAPLALIGICIFMGIGGWVANQLDVLAKKG